MSYFNRTYAMTNNSFGTVMDAASLYDNTNRESLLAVNYQTILSGNLFIDTQYSSRKYDNKGTGSRYDDLIKGTPIWDRSRGSARFNTATYCAVCSNAVDRKDNDDFYAKVNYFLSTKNWGSHNLVGGFDYFDEMRMNNQNSVASGYRVQVTGAIIDGYNIYPILKSGSSTSTAAYITPADRPTRRRPRLCRFFGTGSSPTAARAARSGRSRASSASTPRSIRR